VFEGGKNGYIFHVVHKSNDSPMLSLKLVSGSIFHIVGAIFHMHVSLCIGFIVIIIIITIIKFMI
jgi:hypothetical protein